MAALDPGTMAPPFALNSVDEGIEKQTAFNRLTLLAFYKVTCPTCQLAFRYMDRFSGYEPEGLELVAVAEDDEDAVLAFRSAFGGRFATVTDLPPYRVSEAYGLTNVPTLFLMEPGGRIARTQVGFGKQAYNEISDDIALRLGVAARQIAPPDDGQPDFKPG